MLRIYACSKRVKEGNLEHQVLENEDVAKIAEVVQKLEDQSGACESNFDELELGDNCKEWVMSLLRSESVNQSEMGLLLNDFTGRMQTRSREDFKHAIALLMPEQLVLCHSSYGEETITPEWKTIRRMLDSDNVLRYVSFTIANGTIQVKYWERIASTFFINWLGLPAKTAFAYGGKYRIRCQIEQLTTELFLTEDEMAGYIARHPELRKGKMELPTALHVLAVNQIVVGGKTFQNPLDFIQEFEAGRRGLPKYRRLYSQLVEEFPGSWLDHFDEKDRVIRVEDHEEKVEVTKSMPGDLLFANGNRIHFKASYLNDLFARFANGEPMDVLHAGCTFSDEPFQLQKMRVYVQLKTNQLIRRVCEYCNETSIQDRNLSFLLKYTLTTMLSLTNTGSPISYFFSKLADECLDVTDLNGKWSKLEGLLEYKNSDYFSGNDDEIVTRLAADFKKKLEKSPCTIYLIGVEDDGTLDLVSKTRLGSDRLSGIRDRLQKGLDLACIYVLSIIKEGRGLIVIPALR